MRTIILTDQDEDYYNLMALIRAAKRLIENDDRLKGQVAMVSSQRGYDESLEVLRHALERLGVPNSYDIRSL